MMVTEMDEHFSLYMSYGITALLHDAFVHLYGGDAIPELYGSLRGEKHDSNLSETGGTSGSLARTIVTLRNPVITRVLISSHPIPPAPIISTLVPATCRPD